MFNLRPKNNKGFTLIEILSAVIVLGVVAAIVSPNLLKLMNATRVKDGIAKLEGGIKDGQKQAMRLGKRCQVSIDTTNKRVTAQTVEATPENCLLSNRELDDNVLISTNDPVITFSSKGTPDNTNQSVYVVYMTDGTDEQRCLVVSTGLGIVRSGRYNGDPTTLNGNNCVALTN